MRLGACSAGREGPGNEARGLQCRGEGGRALGMRLGACSAGREGGPWE